MDYAQLTKQLKSEAKDFAPGSFAQTMLLDAAQAIETLEADCADRNRWKQISEVQNKRIDELQAELEQAKAERDAQTNGIHKICKICLLDKYYDCARRIKEG